jgi:hypothetical protein
MFILYLPTDGEYNMTDNYKVAIDSFAQGEPAQTEKSQLEKRHDKCE